MVHGTEEKTMALKAWVDKLEDVPEAFRGEYTQVGDKYELAVDGALELTPIKGLRQENGARRISEKKANDALKVWEPLITGKKPEEILAILDRVPELEAAAAGKIDEKKITEMVENRVGSKLAPVQRELTTVKGQLAEKDQIIAGYQTKERTRAIHDDVRGAIAKTQGFQGSAAEDALMLAERVFEVNDEGKVVTKDGVGVTPGIDATVWLTEMQQKRPHWWGPTQGGGAGGNNGRNQGGSGKNPWTHDAWNMTEQAKIYRENPQRAEQMATSAGTKLGGMKPAKK